jgi:MbtH protein
MKETMYVVVKNHEDQYSIWDADQPVPAGWNVEGAPASKETCLEYIRERWVDMTPASLRKASEQGA